MKLSPTQKKLFIDNIKKVYFGYLTLDFSKTKQIIQVNGVSEKLSVTDLCEHMRRNSLTSLEVSIGGKTHRVSKTQSGKKHTLKIEQPVAFQQQELPIQGLDQYTDTQIANLLTQKPLVLEDDRGQPTVALQLEGKQSFKIGGPKKLDLYRTHLITLSNIIRKLQNEDDLSALLVALATGTGKTFVQILVMEAQLLTGITGIFGVPDELIPQFMDDLLKLMPQSVVSENIWTLRKRTPEGGNDEASEGADRVLNDLSQANGQIIVADSGRLLDDHYPALLNAPTDTTFLTIDEQHLLMANEKRRKRLLTLPEKILCLFLTATPDAETYRLSGSNPVATMSNRQKELAGQGRLPKFETLEVPFFRDLNKKHMSGWRNSWKWLKNEFLIRVPNWIFPEISSAAQFSVERLPFIFHYEPNPRDQRDYGPRWNLHVPTARKMLYVVDDNETLVNLMDYLHNNPAGSKAHIAGKTPELANHRRGPAFRDTALVYSKGAFEPNGIHDFVKTTGDFLTVIGSAAWNLRERMANPDSMPDSDIPHWGTHELIARERAETWAKASAQLPDQATKERMKKFVDRGLVAQLKMNMFHYLIEYVLTDMTGLSSIQLDHMRKTNLDGLVQLVTECAQKSNKTEEDYVKQLTPKIGARAASEIAVLLAGLRSYIQTALVSAESEKVNKFVDNWFLDSSIKDELTTNDEEEYSYSSRRHEPSAAQKFEAAFKKYTRKYLTLSVMADMQGEEMPVEDSKAFRKLSSFKQKVFDENGRFAKTAKKRQRNSLQVLIRAGSEDVFSPEYLDLTETQADNLFRLGFVGTYISNKKHKGFSDLNLHTVVNLAEQTINPNNSPQISIQASGRNRGLNDQVVAAYIHVLGNHQTTHFDQKMLEKDNYYEDFFQAQAKYNDQCIDLLGINLSKRIREIYFAHKGDEAEPINSEALHADIAQEIAKYLREINNRNSHDIALSRKLLTRVVSKAMSELDKEINYLRTPYRVPPFVFPIIRMGASVMQSVLNLRNYSENQRIQEQIKAHTASLTVTLTLPEAQKEVYLKFCTQLRSQLPPEMRENNISLVFSVFDERNTQFADSIRNKLKALQPRVGQTGTRQSKPLTRGIVAQIDTLVRMADGYGYTRQDLLTILNYSVADRATKLTPTEKQYLLPRLQSFEDALRQEQLTIVDVNTHFYNLDQGIELPIQEGNNHVQPEQTTESILEELPALLGNIDFAAQKGEIVQTMLENGPWEIFEHLSRPDLLVLLQAKGYQDADAAAERIESTVKVVQKRNTTAGQSRAPSETETQELSAATQRFERLCLSSSDTFCQLLNEANLCVQVLCESHQKLNQAKIDKTYLKIVQKINRPDVLAALIPAPELLAWFKRKAVPLRNACYNKLIELGIDKNQLKSQLNQRSENSTNDQVALPIELYKKGIKLRDLGYYDPHYYLNYKNNHYSNEEAKELIEEVKTLLEQHSITINEFVEGLSKKEPEEPSMLANLMNELNSLVVISMCFRNVPNGLQLVIDMAFEHLSPILLHPHIAGTFDLVMKHLSKEDLAAILEQTGVENPVESAELMMALHQVLKDGDAQKLINDFLTFPSGQQLEDEAMMKMPIAQAVLGIYHVGSAINDCQTYYLQTDYKEQRVEDENASKMKQKSKFLQSVSKSLLAIRHPYRRMETGIGFAKSVTKGLQQMATIAGDVNREDIKFLKRIKNHILRPIWWTASLSKWAFAVVEVAKKAYFWVRDKAFYVWNKMKALHAWMRGRSHLFQPSVKSQMSADYNNATFEIVKEMNDLRPFTSAEVVASDCAKDTVVKLETVIKARRDQRMFGSVPPPRPSSTTLDGGEDEGLQVSTLGNRNMK